MWNSGDTRDPIDWSLKFRIYDLTTANAALSLLSELHQQIRFQSHTGFLSLWKLFASVDKKGAFNYYYCQLSKATIYLNEWNKDESQGTTQEAPSSSSSDDGGRPEI